MKKRYVTIGSILIIIAWWLGAYYIDNSYILPYPQAVITSMLHQITSPDFYHVVFTTLTRSLIGLCFALFAALGFALCSYYSKILSGLLMPLITLAKSVPNISYIIIILIWFGRESSATIITFLILFPMFYSNFLTGLNSKDKKLMDVLKIYPLSKWQQIIKIDLPMLRPFISASLSSGVGLAFKVGVMAEILGQVDQGIGRELQYCRINLDMAGIFAWTIWIIILLVVLEQALKIFFHPKKH
ncbi:MAG: ABC transporter permease subunit [Erysipelotrichaceae bacterium]